MSSFYKYKSLNEHTDNDWDVAPGSHSSRRVSCLAFCCESGGNPEDENHQPPNSRRYLLGYVCCALVILLIIIIPVIVSSTGNKNQKDTQSFQNPDLDDTPLSETPPSDQVAETSTPSPSAAPSFKLSSFPTSNAPTSQAPTPCVGSKPLTFLSSALFWGCDDHDINHNDGNEDIGTGNPEIPPSAAVILVDPTTVAPSFVPAVVDISQESFTPAPTFQLEPFDPTDFEPETILQQTPEPTLQPTISPTDTPTETPTYNPTIPPTFSPSIAPTFRPTTLEPTIPNDVPTQEPTEPPPTTLEPTRQPTQSPTWSPTDAPTFEPTTRAPTWSPTYPPTFSPTFTPTGTPTFEPLSTDYVPGLLINRQEGLLLSSGLTARLIATTGSPVVYDSPLAEPTSTGGGVAQQVESEIPFHDWPDGGAVFVDTNPSNPGGWIYVSNSEHDSEGEGGVGAITFDRHGLALKYERILNGTTMNCGGGVTPWGTWVSCEEYGDGDGNIYQVDPSGKRPPQKMTLGSEGGDWESFAFDIRDRQHPFFFVTEDTSDGALQRFSPAQVDWVNDPWRMLHGNGTIEYLVLTPSLFDGDSKGSFRWTRNQEEAKQNAEEHYPNTEGIDVHDGIMYFVCKDIKMMFQLDLDAFTYTRQSTESGAFSGEPDQLRRIITNGAQDNHFLFFTEDGGDMAGIHGRDETGMFFTLLQSPEHSDETTGLAFNPDHTHLYIAYQDDGLLFDITRIDGQPFHAMSLDIKYHATS